MRIYFEEQLQLKERELEQEREGFQQEREGFQQEREGFQQEIQDKDFKIQETERHNLLLNELMIDKSKIEAAQVVYIATSASYANQNRFKVGGVEAASKLQSRLYTYNSRSAAGDDFYYTDIILVVDYKQIEARLKSLMIRFRDRSSKEIYVLHYTNLKYIIQFFCEHYNEETDYVNEHLLQFIENLNQCKLRPLVPPRTTFNYASITNIKEDGNVYVCNIQSTNKKEFIKKIEEYVETLECNQISKKEVFDELRITKGRKELLPLLRAVFTRKRPDIVLSNVK
jgi:hypothetical protein